MTLIFENSAWKIFRIQNGRRLAIKSKSGLGVAYASITGREYTYSTLDLYGRGGRITYLRGEIVPSYIKSKCTVFFRTGRNFR